MNIGQVSPAFQGSYSFVCRTPRQAAAVEKAFNDLPVVQQHQLSFDSEADLCKLTLSTSYGAYSPRDKSILNAAVDNVNQREMTMDEKTAYKARIKATFEQHKGEHVIS